MKWSDFDNGKWNIIRSVSVEKGGDVVIGETKTDKGKRTIILPQSTIDILENRNKASISEWIFHNPCAPEKPVNPSSAYHRLKKILRENNLPNIRFHGLRHTFATHALTSGVDAKTLSGILGHTNASFTLDTYTHMTTDMQRNAAVIVGSFINKII